MKVLLLLTTIVASGLGHGTCPAGWSKWLDEKCYKLFPNFSTAPNARDTCVANGAVLSAVKEEAQQEYLTNYLFLESQVEIGVWIGANRVGESFEWDDGTVFDYTNWGEGSPTDLNGRNCVVMQSKYSKVLNGSEIMDVDGTWKDVSCSSPNYFVCEKVPLWSEDELQNALIETRKKLDNLLNNPVAIGFIYTQYPGHPEPQDLWPIVTWTEISEEFDGSFFRALGRGSAEFGMSQAAESSGGLTRVKMGRNGGKGTGEYVITPGQWSSVVITGDEPAFENNAALQFLTSAGEARPRNTAIRIWMRTA